MKHSFITSGLMALALVASSVVSVTPAFAESIDNADVHSKGTLVTASNAVAGNSLLFLNDKLEVTKTIPTGGTGTGGGLGNQGGIASNERVLLVVNAGDNTISSFTKKDDELSLVGKVGSHGVQPISLTISGNVAYVVNAGDNTIAGYSIGAKGALTFIPGSAKTLSGVAPAQISFASANGKSEKSKVLIVTEKGSNTIEVFPLQKNLPGTSVVTPSVGATPFGFDVVGNTIRVSEAFGGTASALSTYRLNADGTLTTISGSVAAPGQKAACWVASTKDGRVSFVTNTGSNTVSSYSVTKDGTTELLQDVAATTTSGPIEMVVQGSVLYVQTAQGIASFVIGTDGSLTAESVNTLARSNGLIFVQI